jgi:hypothetical protein
MDKVVWLGGYACPHILGYIVVTIHHHMHLWTMPLEGLGFDVHVVIIIFLDPHGQPWSGARWVVISYHAVLGVEKTLHR